MKFVLYIAFFFLLLGCKKAADRKCWKSIGELRTYRVAIEPFTDIELNDHLDMSVSLASDWSVEIYTGKNLINHIGVEVKNNRLILKDNNTCDFLRDLGHKTIVHVYGPSTEKIVLRGSGNTEGILSGSSIEIDGREANGSHTYQVNHDTVRCLIHDGSTDLTLAGNTDFAYYYHFGSGTINAKKLMSNDVVINWQSINDLTLSISNSIAGSIESFGDVYYYGTPTLNVGTSSSGQLIKAD